MSRAGWLTKEGGHYKTWKRRYFVIEGSSLAYYKRDNKKEKCGMIPLQGAEIQVAKEEVKGHPFMFEVKTSARLYRICASDDVELQYWVRILQDAQAGKLKKGAADDLPPLPPRPAKEHKSGVSLEDFDLLKVIGKGSFGKVLLVRKKDNNRVYAMKILSKKTVVERNEVEHTKSEKSILMKLEFPFLVGLRYSFQSKDKLYIVMDYVNGGELFFHLQKEKKFSEERVRFYGAEIVLGLEYLHSAGVIYRDLKPENLLLTNEGHLVMTDFGLSKEGLHEADDKTQTFCGTPEYLAPEILEGQGYTKAVDWWSFGTLLFEMLTGLPPFYSEDVQQMYAMIMAAQLVTPETISPEAKDLLHKLLERDPEKRLCAPEIKDHPFFKGIDWDLLLQKKIKPPWVPEVTGEDDTRNIDAQFLQERVEDDAEEAVSDAIANSFEGFTYTGHSE